MKGIVIYKGKYGATAQYANWISEALHLSVCNLDDLISDNMDNYDFIILGSSIYIGKLLIKDWLHKNQYLLEGKKVFLFVVSGSTTDNIDQQTTVLKNNVPSALLTTIEVFFLPGRVIVSKLSWFDRLMIKVGAMMEKDPAKRALMRRGFDSVRKESINKLTGAAIHYSNAEALP